MGHEETQSANTTPETVITFGAPEGKRQIYEPLIHQFNTDNPGIRVQFVPVAETGQLGRSQPEVVRQTMQTIASAVDTAVLEQPRPMYAASETLLDLAPLINADPSFNRADYYPAALPTGNTILRVLPLRIQVPLLAYNTNLWQARSVPKPDLNWSWPDLLAAAEQITQSPAGTPQAYGLADRADVPGAVLALLGEIEMAGVDPFDPLPGQPVLDQPAIAQALERTAARIQSGTLMAPPAPDQAGNVVELIRTRLVGLWPVEQWATPEQLPFAAGIAPFPSGRMPATTIFEGLVISGGTRDPQAAWRWLTFLSRQTVASAGTFVPINVVSALTAAHQRDPAWQQLDSEAQETLQIALGRPAFAQSAPRDQAVIDALTTALLDVIQRGRPAEALRAAEASLAQATGPTGIGVATPIPVAAPPPPPADAVTQISFESSFNNRRDLFPRVVQQFNHEHSDIQVTFHFTNDPNSGASLQDLAGRSDCFVSFGPSRQDDLQSVLELGPLMGADAGFSRDDFLPGMFAPLQRAGQPIGLPLAAHLLVVGYNKALFDDRGLAYPQADWTMDDLLHAAERLTQGDGPDRTYGFLYRAGEMNVYRFSSSSMGPRRHMGAATCSSPTLPTQPSCRHSSRSSHWYALPHLSHEYPLPGNRDSTTS